MSIPGRVLMPNFTALVTLLAVILYFWLGFRVGQARVNFGVKAPATTGHPDFERTFRIQMNTLEWMPIFLRDLAGGDLCQRHRRGPHRRRLDRGPGALHARLRRGGRETRDRLLRAGDRGGGALACGPDRRAGVDGAWVERLSLRGSADSERTGNVWLKAALSHCWTGRFCLEPKRPIR
jgi:MAPEG family